MKAERTAASTPRLIHDFLGWTARVTEIHLDAGVECEANVLPHLLASIPGQRPAQVFGQFENLLRKLILDVLGKPITIESAEHDKPRLALHQSRYGGLRPLADNQIAFPMTRNGTVVGFRRAFADQHHVLQLAGAGYPTQGSPLNSSRTQAVG